MPDEDKKTVDIDTSGPDATIDIEETKDESVVETETPKQETDTDKTFENERETKLEEKKDDDKLEDYSKGVQARIAKLTRKMREAERREQAAVEYAQNVQTHLEQERKKATALDSSYLTESEGRIESQLAIVEANLKNAVTNGDGDAAVEAQKVLAQLGQNVVAGESLLASD